MARFDARVTLDTSRLDRIIKNSGANAHDLVRAVAFAVEAQAKPRTAIDTGALRNSIYTRIGAKVDGGAAAHAEARARNPKAELVTLPEPQSNTVAHVGPGVAYGLEQEFGSARQAGHPYLVPAVREVERDLARQFSRELRRVATDG